MALDIRKITNGNVYIDGANYLGRVEEATLSEVKWKMTEHKALGLVGSVEFPSGIDKMEATLKWSGFYNEALLMGADPFTARQIMVRGSVEKYEPNGRTAQVAVVMYFTATPKNTQGGSFKQHDNWDASTMFNVTACKIVYDGVTLLEYDALANIYKVAGSDLLAAYKVNTGAA